MPTASQLIHSYSVSLLRACHTDKGRIHNIAAAQSQHNHDSSTAAAQSQRGHDSSITPNGLKTLTSTVLRPQEDSLHHNPEGCLGAVKQL